MTAIALRGAAEACVAFDASVEAHSFLRPTESTDVDVEDLVTQIECELTLEAVLKEGGFRVVPRTQSPARTLQLDFDVFRRDGKFVYVLELCMVERLPVLNGACVPVGVWQAMFFGVVEAQPWQLAAAIRDGISELARHFVQEWQEAQLPALAQ